MSAGANDTMKHDVTERASALQTFWAKARRFLEPQLGDEDVDDEIRNGLDDAEELLSDAVQKIDKALIACTRRLRTTTKGRTVPQEPVSAHAGHTTAVAGGYAFPAPVASTGRQPLQPQHDAWAGSQSRTWHQAKQNASSRGEKRRYDGASEFPTHPKEARQQLNDQRQSNQQAAHTGRQSNRQQQYLLPVELLAQIPQDHISALLEADIVATVRKATRSHLSNRNASPQLFSEHETPLAIVAKRERTQSLLNLLDPPVELAAFVAEKLSHQYTMHENRRGELVVKEVQKTEPGEFGRYYKERKKALQDGFFASLPQDELTHEEQEFRDALMRYLDNWREPTAPYLFKALLPGPGLGNEIGVARYTLLHPDVAVVDWITHRIGADIEVTEDDGKGPQFYRNTDSFRL